MFLKSLLISTPTKVIREINFHKGLNLIVDETPSGDTLTGNNVGKTTVLRLIDFCLGKDGSVVYKDPENSREIDPMVKSFLIDRKVIITLTIVDNLENPQREVEISRNFLSSRRENVCQVNGRDITKSELESVLGAEIFPQITISKPTFRQIIAHNVRYDDLRLNHTLDILNSFTKLEEYETLYLFMFGCDYDEGAHREELIANIKSELNYKKRLEKRETKSSYKVALEDVEREIKKLEAKKTTLNINPQIEQDLAELSSVKERLNQVTSLITSLRIRKDVIEESVREFNAQQFTEDISELRLIYQQASSLIPDMQRTFEDMVEYHNKMLANRVKFIEEELPALDTKIASLTSELASLRKFENELSAKVIASDTFEDLEKIINDLNEQYKRKGEYSAIISQIDEVEKTMSKFNEELSAIDNGLFSDDFRKKVDSQLS